MRVDTVGERLCHRLACRCQHQTLRPPVRARPLDQITVGEHGGERGHVGTLNRQDAADLALGDAGIAADQQKDRRLGRHAGDENFIKVEQLDLLLTGQGACTQTFVRHDAIVLERATHLPTIVRMLATLRLIGGQHGLEECGLVLLEFA